MGRIWKNVWVFFEGDQNDLSQGWNQHRSLLISFTFLSYILMNDNGVISPMFINIITLHIPPKKLPKFKVVFSPTSFLGALFGSVPTFSSRPVWLLRAVVKLPQISACYAAWTFTVDFFGPTNPEIPWKELPKMGRDFCQFFHVCYFFCLAVSVWGAE